MVVELFQQDSWSFFNKYLFQLFISGRDWLIAAVTGDTSTNKIGVFGFIDDIFNVFFSSGTWIKIVSLMPYGVGVVFLLIIIAIMIIYLVTLSRVIVAYLLIIVGISVLTALAPIFIVLLLFKRTKKYFDNWIKHLVDYALQPVVMFATLFVMNVIFMEFWNNAMDFTVCFGKIIDVYFPLQSWTSGFLPNVQLGCIQSYIPVTTPNFFTMFVQLVSLSVMAIAILGMIGHVPSITSAITGSNTAGSIAKTADGMAKKGMDFAQSTIKTTAIEGKKLANRVSNALRGGGNSSPETASIATKPEGGQEKRPSVGDPKAEKNTPKQEESSNKDQTKAMTKVNRVTLKDTNDNPSKDGGK